MNKKNMKKWMALFLSLAMILTSGVLTISPGLLASEENTYENSAQEDSQGASEENAEAQQTSQEAQIPEAQNSSGESAAESQQSEQTSEPAAQETETNNESVSMPAQSFKATASNGVTVKVNAPEGALPAGSTMHVTPVSAKTAKNIASQTASHEVKDAVGVDITFRDSSGKETEPAAAVDVHMYLSSKLEGDSFTVSHKADSGNVSQVSASASAGGASFSESSFSIYVISGEGEENIPVATYNFHDANGVVIDTQNVKTGDTLNKPSSPEKEGYKLVGWSTTKDASTPDFDGFGKVTVNKEETINVYPVFQEVHYVFFMDGTDDSSRVSTTKEGVEGGKISTTDVKLPLESTKSVTGWYTDKALTSPAGDTVTLGTKNIKLYPKIEEGHYLQFASGEGATYIAPQFVAANKGTKKPSDPKRPGYTFVGWSTEKNGTTANFNFGDTISEDTTVYAVWEAKNDTQYTVIYWWENANDSGYSYHESASKKGQSGETVSTSSLAKTYNGFTLNTDKTKKSVTIAGDGSTIVNIYYTRNTYSIKFYKAERKVTWFGRVHYEWPEMTGLRITAKYGADIADKWPSATSKIWGTKKGEYGQGASPYQSGIATMPLDGGAFYYVSQNGKNTMNLNYYVEGLDGKYTLDHTDSFKTDNTEWSTTAEDHYDIPGFTYTDNVKDGTYFEEVTYYTYKIDFKYSRNTYNINFINGDNKRSESYKYGADISGVDLKTTPKRPSGVPESYTFAGWYDNELGAGDPVKLSGTMPAKNITLYAKWAAPEVNGKAYLTVNGGDSVDLQLEYGDKIGSSQLPSVYDSQGHLVQTGSSKKIVIPAGYDWKGWATKDGDSFTLFNFNTEIYSDIELYPFYVSNGKYKVEYSAGAGTGSVEDSKLYAEGSHADVQYASAIKAPAGKVFLYWQSESGSHYYPDDKIAVNSTNAGDDKVITLTAVYGSKAAATKLTYKSNYPDKAIDENGSEISAQTYDQKYNGSTDLNNNTRLKTLTIGQTGFTLPLEYQFTGWNTKADGSGKAIAAKASADQMADILVDNKGDNILYAQWTKKPVTEITVKPEDKSKTYDGTALKADSYKITGGSLGEGDKIVATYSGSQTDAGSSDSSFATFKIMHNGKVDVTSKLYKVTLQKGKLEVTKRKVTLTTGSDEKTYDGTPLTKDGVTVSGDKFVDGEVSDIKATGSRTDAGTSKNTLSYNKLSGFKDGNYEIKEILGDLTVKKANTLTVSATGYKGIYDGNSHSASAIPSVSKGTTVYYQTDGGQWTTKVPSIKDVGEKTVSVKAENPNYETATAGPVTLQVTPKEVTVTARNKEKVYQAADPEFDADVSGKVEGDKFEIQYTLSREKGEAAGTYAITPEGEKTQGNYTVTYKPGTLTITKSGKLTVSATGYEGVYDGAAHSASASPNVADGTTVSYKVGDDGTWSTDAPSITDAGTKKVYVKAENPNYETATAETTLKVTRKPVTVTANDASKVFGENDPDKFTADVDGLLGNDKIVFNVNRMAGEDAGTYAITPSGDSEQGNYEVTYKNGTFTIYKSKALTVSAPDYSGEYDGRSHGATAVAKAGDHPAPTGTKIYYSTSENGPWSEKSPEIKDRGSKTVYVKAENPNFETARNSATLTVTPKEVTVTADDKSKKYGEKDPELTASVKGTINGDTVKYQLSRESGENVGKYDITPSGKEDQGNYTVKYAAGKLVVTKRNVTLESGSAYKRYDKKPLTSSEMSVSGDGFAPGEGAEYDFTGTQTEKGESENTFTYKLHENTLEGNYNIEVKYGKLVVDDPILYTATIHYRDAAGNTLAPDFAGKYMAGDSFTITSPAVPGYTPQQTYVTMDSMPERDVEVTVVYTANAVPGPGPGPGPSPIPTVVPGIAPGLIAAAPGGAAIASGPTGDGLTQLKDVKTAKGLKELHEKCNILPFLFMLLTIIVVIAYSKAMKKDQEEIFQLKEELESRRRF
ncbi:MBG domain-containing protein [Baileyella intestinalis]|uniref:MBG domain-containing protein n=1 Tax=Baileyella intestinalis TaxID=2606709 RepID=UPI003A881582